MKKTTRPSLVRVLSLSEDKSRLNYILERGLDILLSVNVVLATGEFRVLVNELTLLDFSHEVEFILTACEKIIGGRR